MKTLILTVIGLPLLFLAAEADAQDRWALELRGGGAFPTQDIADDGLGAGVALEATFSYKVSSSVAAYAGWGWAHFNPDQSFAGTDIDFEETGYTFGLRLEQPLGDDSPLGWWLRAGGTVDHLELEDASGDVVADSGHGLGFEAATGLSVELGDRWRLTPGFRYSSLSRDVDIGSETTGIDLRYAALEVGLAWSF